MASEKESGEETFKSRQNHPQLQPPRHPQKTSPAQRGRSTMGERRGDFSETSSSWRQQCPLCSFLIYEVLLLKIPSANRQFCDTGLLFFPAFL